MSEIMILLKPILDGYRNVKDLNLARNVKNCYKIYAQIFLDCMLALILAG